MEDVSSVRCIVISGWVFCEDVSRWAVIGGCEQCEVHCATPQGREPCRRIKASTSQLKNSFFLSAVRTLNEH